jgi:hypothetical protein
MDKSRKVFWLRLDEQEPLPALEAALAIVRRTNVRVHGMWMAPARCGMTVELHLEASDDALHLCYTRFCNTIDIQKVWASAGDATVSVAVSAHLHGRRVRKPVLTANGAG